MFFWVYMLSITLPKITPKTYTYMTPECPTGQSFYQNLHGNWTSVSGDIHWRFIDTKASTFFNQKLMRPHRPIILNLNSTLSAQLMLRLVPDLNIHWTVFCVVNESIPDINSTPYLFRCQHHTRALYPLCLIIHLLSKLQQKNTIIGIATVSQLIDVVADHFWPCTVTVGWSYWKNKYMSSDQS